MSKKELIAKIIQKKEFSELREKDVLLAFNNFDKEEYLDEEKVKLTRDLLRKVFSSFTSKKLLQIKDKDESWFLKKHLSTRERFNHYEKIYSRILKGMKKEISIIDLGSGINGLSYNYFKKIGFNVKYLGAESIGQFVKLMNHYFRGKKIKGKSIHLSLFELGELKKIIKKIKRPKVIFLFKTLDSLEMLERDYSKKLLLNISPLVDRIAVSFPTRSMKKRRRFAVNRKWIYNFIEENFEILDDFELGDERYLVFENK